MYARWNELFEIPIEELSLSVKTINALKRTGVTMVGDCLDHFERAGDVLIQVPFGFLEAMHGEVREKLLIHAKWAMRALLEPGKQMEKISY